MNNKYQQFKIKNRIKLIKHFIETARQNEELFKDNVELKNFFQGKREAFKTAFNLMEDLTK